jgi:P-type Mg2+ transporter
VGLPGRRGAAGGAGRYRRLDTLPFDHERRAVSVLAEDDRGNRMIITKGAPESLLARCSAIPAAARTALEAEFAAGNRVVAVATRETPGQSSITPADEHGLTFRGLLVFLDPPKPDARAARERLARLGVSVKILTGDNPEHKAQIVRTQRATGTDVAFLGDGVNDAVALHTADVGISVDSATDVARDAADVLLLEKNLDVLADGVMGGRRIFATR